MPDATPAHVHRISWPLLALSLLGVAALTLLPIGWQLNRFVVWLYYSGLQLWRFPVLRDISMDTLAVILNVLLMVPVAFTAMFALPHARWWQLAAAILVLSGAIEIAQAALPLGREGSIWDVAANALGGAAGAVLAAECRSRWTRSRTPLPARQTRHPPAA
ncbi:VanZ family protein [Aestuariimicrobium sp. p3-SID1156]|uniref:VanZ family protein n=1 Tax=Aestuariimicrobium sp. p3-SID1156 TaxID=2916038 RepID=UPI00223AFC1B|nr:VanZ family protein [Aestuariimicrobium sp. p3-SID1156]MCT1458289.1 VanZ family protein [Aestuariimicrobium sp. p3-SID1156]